MPRVLFCLCTCFLRVAVGARKDVGEIKLHVLDALRSTDGELRKETVDNIWYTIVHPNRYDAFGRLLPFCFEQYASDSQEITRGVLSKYATLGRTLLNDKAIAEHAVLASADTYEILPPKLQSDIDVARSAVLSNPNMVKFLPARLRDDEGIMSLLAKAQETQTSESGKIDFAVRKRKTHPAEAANVEEAPQPKKTKTGERNLNLSGHYGSDRSDREPKA